MNIGDAVSAAFASFERVLRWIYPGLLVWIALPLAFHRIGSGNFGQAFTTFYGQLPAFGHIGVILVGGFLVYMLERYLVHEPILGLVYFHLGVGAAVNFKRNREGKDDHCYPWPNGRLLWPRFGLRPADHTPIGEQAETRFTNYMASRMAAIHALGCTWIVGLLMFAIGHLIAKESSFKSWPWYGQLTFWLFEFLAIMFWLWHAWIAARAEQDHYKPSQTST